MGPRVYLYVGNSPNFHHSRQLGNVVKACTMLSGILIFNQKGENLIFRAFRSDCRPRLADIFRIQVISNPQLRSPTLTLGSTTFSHVKHENIYLVAITKSNANAALVFEFLYRLIALGKGYFGKFDEEAVKNNFVLVYELLDGELWRLCVPALC
jgi:AP-2 complex subunit mu-1